VLDAGARQFRFASGPGHAGGVEAILRAPQLLARGLPLTARRLELGLQFARFHLEPLFGFDRAFALRPGRLDGGGERGDRVHHGVDVGA
jgi:hypothetical protein